MNLTPVYGYVTEDMINKNNLIMFNINREEVENNDYSRINHFIGLLEKAEKKAYGNTMLAFMYDDDPREIYEIDEICLYMLNIFKKCPQLFYYLVPNAEVNLSLIYCLAGVKIISKDNVTAHSQPIDIDIYNRCLYTIRENTLKYGSKINDKKRAIKTLKALGLYG